MVNLQWSRDGRTLLGDGALALAFAVATVPPLLVNVDSEFVMRSLPWSLVMCGALLLRRMAPLAALTAVGGAGVGMAAMLSTPVPAILAVPVVVYSVGRYQRMSAVFPVAVLGVAGSLAGPITWTVGIPDPYRVLGTTLLVLLCAAIVALAYLWGRFLRERALTQSLDREIVTERFSAAQRSAEQELELAERRARAGVAQELHDVLAHSLSVIVVQAEGARALTAKRPEAAAEALDVIADTGRTSIAEVRRIVALMRGDDESAAFGPSPSLAEIPGLVESAGGRITLTVEGPTPIVPESLGLTAFRVMQEAITNVLKHAGPTATAEARVGYATEHVELLVRDDGIGSLSRPDGTGSGLRGMRERVVAMGGEFRAGPRPGGGYEVWARLPMPNQLGKSWLRGATT
ncbi:sensor histidine kinase [Tessaracoccus lapidicaptus]|uniref:sensor histidine kinase n=1 Tax=Tessaracoccus lapidicaptus TaxID=1427523 RepID=UPI003340DEBC